jgi:uncharacterized protein HemX
MKAIIIAVAIVIGMVVILQLQWTAEHKNQSSEVENEVVEVTPTEEELDVIDKAQKELERINQELDIKETELLEQREQIDAELERLRQTRVSFQ